MHPRKPLFVSFRGFFLQFCVALQNFFKTHDYEQNNYHYHNAHPRRYGRAENRESNPIICIIGNNDAHHFVN